ncbi:MAG: UDP-2,3-diacylglucosamine diphosphatase LpxI, partial [Nitrospira sp.]|nr:UDP-2,3-diacylglucosamine diphosphatase LpxI [Nitrospira sp.]
DMRFDLPAVGPRTIDVMASVKASVLAVEAGRTVILDRDELVGHAERAGIAVIGIAADSMKREA